MAAVIEVPEPVRRKALALGPEGERWLTGLGNVVAELETEWNIEVGNALVGGSGGYVAEAVCVDGRSAVLKVAIPEGLDGQGPFAGELETLRLGSPGGYVRVLAFDEHCRAMLQERLGRPLSTLALPVDSQIDIIAATLGRAWRDAPAATTLRTGAEQAWSLGESVRADWERLRRPCPEPTIARAEQFARNRRAAFDTASSVMIHGDAHPANVLEAGGADQTPDGFKLIDPDGMISERAHDLAIPLRDWTEELLATDPVTVGRAWCARLSACAGVRATPIWEWAFLERVSTGLFMTRLGDPFGLRLLEVANLWTDVEP